MRPTKLLPPHATSPAPTGTSNTPWRPQPCRAPSPPPRPPPRQRPALASPIYTLNSTGGVVRWDSPSSPTVIAQSGSSGPEGLAVTPDGTIYTIGYDPISLYRIDPVTHVSTQMPPLQPPSLQPFFKDLAWDPAGNRLLALNWGPILGNPDNRNRLMSIDLATFQVTTLGELSGLNPPGQIDTIVNGLAVDATGQIFVSTNSQVYRLGGPTGFALQPLPSPLGGNNYNGLAIDWSGTGQMLVSGDNGVYTVNANGAASIYISSPGFYKDVAFSVPSPVSTAALLALATLRAAARPEVPCLALPHSHFPFSDFRYQMRSPRPPRPPRPLPFFSDFSDSQILKFPRLSVT